MDWVLELRNHPFGDYFTTVFHLLTLSGDITFFLVFLPLGFWLWRRNTFARATLLLLISTLLNTYLKAYFHEPRPEIPHLVHAEGWSFPSGHAQAAATLWPWLVLELRKHWLWPLALTLVLGVAMSRVYLGVHYPRDVLVGMLVGGCTVLLGWPLTTWIRRRWDDLKPRRTALFLVLALGMYFTLFPGPVDLLTATAAGSLAGFALTILLFPGAHHRKTLLFPPPSSLRMIIAVVCGLAVAFALRIGLKPVFASLGVAPALASFLRYGLIGVWLAGLAPICFVAVGCARWPTPLENEVPPHRN